MKAIETKLDPRSLLLGAVGGALVMLCVAAAQTQSTREGETTKTDAAAASAAADAKPAEVGTERVTGIGGVFFKAKDPKGVLAWYRQNLGFPVKGSYIDFTWRDKDHPDQIGHTAWRIFPTNSTYFGQSSSHLMINYRVANIDRILEQLRRNGVTVEKTEDFNYGRFAWITDLEGNRIELWEPK